MLVWGAADDVTVFAFAARARKSSLRFSYESLCAPCGERHTA